jgi:hypothetical protein
MTAAAVVIGSDQTGVAPSLSDPAAIRAKAGVSASPVSEPQSRRYGKLPLSFVSNRGQTNKRVRYYAQGPGVSLYLTKREAVLALAKEKKSVALHLRFLRASPDARIEPSERGSGKVNYFKGSAPDRRYTDLPTYGRVVYHDLWPGIDMVFRGSTGALKYEFLVHPGANVENIRLAYEGATGLTVGSGGRLSIGTTLGTVSEARPRSYQRIGHRTIPIASRFSLSGKGARYGFEVGRAYNPRYPLVIDPYLAYSTFLGGSDRDEGNGIVVDSAGNAFVTGWTGSTNFPVTPGAYDTSTAPEGDAFVTKLNPSGSSLVYSTFLDAGYPQDVAVDDQGRAYITGTAGPTLPVTPAAYDTTYNGNLDAFVAELSAAGDTLLYSTYLGGAQEEARVYDQPHLALDAAGSAYVTGHTNSSDFPVTPGAFDTTFNSFPSYLGGDNFVTKLNPDGSALVYSTFVGGGGREDQRPDIAVASDGSAFVTGGTASTNFPVTTGAYDTTFNGTANFNAYVTKLNPAGSGVVYSTLLGSNTDNGEHSITLDALGNAYVTGSTTSASFPTTAAAADTALDGARDVYVTKLNVAGSGLVYSTYLGGSGQDDESPSGIELDTDGASWVVGGTRSANFPTTRDAVDRFLSGLEDGFVSKLNPAGSALLYSSFLGGSSYDGVSAVAVDAAGSAYTTGTTTDGFFQTTPGAYDTTYNGIGEQDAFVTKIAGSLRSYPRPVGASPLAIAFVPAFEPCETSNADSQHGSPLGFPSCSNPTPASSTVRMGSNAISIARIVVCAASSAAAFCNPPTSLPKPDVRFTGSIRDVRCASTLPVGCVPGADYDPNSGPGPYTDAGNGRSGATPPCFPSGTSGTDCVASADLTETARLPGDGVGGAGTNFEGKGVRITDSANGSPSVEATTTDIGFPIPLDCIQTADPGQGSACGVNTTANALVAGVVQGGEAAVWRLGELQLVDSGPDGVRGNSDDELFAVQGIFLP